MLLSVANSKPRNVESISAVDLIPSYFHETATNLIDLISEYYEFMNSEGLPSAEISSITTLRDIDNVSLKYFSQIQSLIGRSVPTSRVMDKVQLYKIVVKYYNSRGSEDSIHTFFKIFFDEVVKIFYPKEFLFDLSAGVGEWTSKSVIDYSNMPILRETSDYLSKTITDISFSGSETSIIDGSAQLYSIRYLSNDANSYQTQCEYYKGAITILPGSKSRISITADDLGLIGLGSIPDLYCSGLGNQNKPVYTENLFGATGPKTLTRMFWQRGRWKLIIGSDTGDLIEYYSNDNVADPTLVTTWTAISPSYYDEFQNTWVDENGYPIGSNIIENAPTITSISFEDPIYLQALYAFVTNDSVTDNLVLDYDIENVFFDDLIVPSARVYLTSNELPLTEVGELAIVNGGRSHPYSVGIISEIYGELTWHIHVLDEWIYSKEKSLASDRFKITDGHFWQNFSYSIRTDLDSSEWLNDYLKFVHPAGLKLFASIVLELESRNEWLEELDYSSDDLENDDSWMQALIPPYIFNRKSIGFHTPRYQPGYLNDRYLRFIFKYLRDNENLLRLAFVSYLITIGEVDARNSYVRKNYQISEKFIDNCMIKEGWLDKTIDQALEEYSNTNICRMLNLSSEIIDPFEYSSRNETITEFQANWTSSSTDDSPMTPQFNWSLSSYDDLET